MKKISFGMLVAFFSLCIGQTVAQTLTSQIDEKLSQLVESKKLQANDLTWAITDQNVSSTSGVVHIYYRQVVNGLEVYGTESGMHFTADGSVLTQNNRFINGAANRATTGANPSISAVQAVQAAADQLGYAQSGGLSVIERKSGASQETLISKGALSLSNIPAKLTYQLDNANQLTLAWDLSIQEVSGHDWWSVRVNASTGAIIDQVNWIVSCNLSHTHGTDEIIDYNKNLYDIPNYTETVAPTTTMPPNSYEVIAMPIESPYFGARTIETNPADVLASPFGWHDTNGVAGAEFTVTKGNNVDAYEDGDNFGFQPDGGATLDFTGAAFPFNQIYTNTNQYESAAITNLFYWNNIIHDVLFHYGFDEAGGNFQELNYSGSGAGSDSVNAEAQDGSGTCNANFGTPPDGSNPQMQMYICGDKDGDFDNLVVVHEYGHGVSNRLTGGPSQSGCLGNTEQMGEGWSDYLGAILTMEPGDMGTDSRAVGTYLFGQGPGGGGIRPFPYSTDFGVNPQTYDDIKTAAVPHGVGSVWATTLWEVTWELIAEYGVDNNIYNFTGDVNLDAGNVQALAIVMEGMKLQPCSPGFVDGRDAIFAADQALYGGANECFLWDAFARRGLGVSADQGSSNSRSDGTEAFDTPSGTADFAAPNDVCEGSPVITDLGGGSPFGGVYSGPGVTDDGNGNTYSFDPVAAGAGIHTITYTVQDGACSLASSDSDDIEVIAIAAAPATTGDDIVCGEEDATVTATPNDPANIILWYDAASGGNVLAEGTSYTFSPTMTTSVYAQERPPLPTSKLVVSELTFETPDRLEIQNVGEAFDYSGYTVAISDQPFGTLNNVNPVTQTLGNMGADSVVAWSDDSGSGDYWGSNIWWGNGDGWVIIIDDVGNVVDSVFWNMTEQDISGLNVTINGFNITANDLDFMGDGISLTVTCNNSFRRVADTDTGADFADVCLASDYGTPNTDIGDVSGDLGCLSQRGEAEVLVGVDTTDPVVTCPADESVTVNAGEQYTLPDYTTTIVATDNCTVSPVITQDPVAGTQVGPGVTTITITATDDASNEASCTFDVTVEELLSVEDIALANGIALDPNPTAGMLTLSNTSSLNLTDAIITDVNGRVISTIDLSGAGASTAISLERVATGLYFVRINSETASVVKRIVKK
ncbi:T9SS type A sorting domain-containing protein [Rasiella rasia]|uniref:T9SS type A sorting domain-containing protein n=1 Tax=Rasiella rasia TaxID=2744027 RepID=A0A6G6GHX6_9FLAO|nr:M36 family metallopeptidase [Rasiella rasia]QIE58149.1 T9SS type A sorting domain-containing protein [Rasiella rasia]